MFVEKQDRYPKGTYKLSIAMRADVPGATAGFHLVNLSTGRHTQSGAIWDLVASIEDDIFWNKYPQSEIKYRTWGGIVPEGSLHAARPAIMDKAMQVPDTTVKGPSFLIRVLYRQNATWQGTVQWLEGRQTRQYRSVNELLRLIGEAVEFTQAAPGAEAMG